MYFKKPCWKLFAVYIMEMGRMKSVFLVLLCIVFSVLCLSCSFGTFEDANSSENSNSSSEDSNSQNPFSEVGVTDFFYMGEHTEVLSEIQYTVKEYAAVYANEYFYTYYKCYYLGDSLRRIYVFSHLAGSDLDYTYKNFTENSCPYYYYYTYYDNGKKESYSYYINGILVYEYAYYSNGKERFYKYYNTSSGVSVLSSETNYYPNGTMRFSKTYSTSSGVSVPYSEKNYYESGNLKSSISYFDNGQVSYLTEYYDVSPSVKKKVIDYNSDGTREEEFYYSNGKLNLVANFNSDNTIKSFTSYYESGYKEYKYESNYLYKYRDNSSSYTSKTSYTNDQAESMLETLRPKD